MQKIRTEDAVGQVLCHDVTRIVQGDNTAKTAGFKGAQFRKGHIIQAEDIPVLLSMGKEHVYVWELEKGMLHENDAAQRLCSLCRNAHMRETEIREGKVELLAEIDGLFRVDSQRLEAVNSLGEIMIATKQGNTAANSGERLAGMRAIPLVIKEAKLDAAQQAAGASPLMELLPYRLGRAAIITTGSEVYRGRIKDTFTPVVEKKLDCFGIKTTFHKVVDDGIENIGRAIAEARETDAELILCTGGMSVDPDDNTPGAIKAAGADIVAYGAPVLPGAMLLMGYFDRKLPVMGLPGCVMYAKTTVFDLILPLVAAKVEVTKNFIVSLGEGGLM